jgi:hypothetical protein
LFKVTLGPLLEVGLGVVGEPNQLAFGVPGPRGLGELKDDRFALSNPPPIALLNNGLAAGENGDPLGLPEVEFPFADRGEGEYELLGDPLWGVDERGYRGGVTY